MHSKEVHTYLDQSFISNYQSGLLYFMSLKSTIFNKVLLQIYLFINLSQSFANSFRLFNSLNRHHVPAKERLAPPYFQIK
jgi:hypothetical protein